MVKISIEIRECKNGYIVQDSYFGEEEYVETFKEAMEKSNELFKNFETDQKNMDEEIEYSGGDE